MKGYPGICMDCKHDYEMKNPVCAACNYEEDYYLHKPIEDMEFLNFEPKKKPEVDSEQARKRLVAMMMLGRM